MNLFTWFFVIPGLLLVALGVLGLREDRKGARFDAAPSTAATSTAADHRTLVSSAH